MMGVCANPAMSGESRERIPRVAVAQPIPTKEIVEPAALALSVDTPPPKA